MYGLVMLVALAYMPNKAGGDIVITDAQVPVCEGYLGAAYSTSPVRETIAGCWSFDGHMLHIKWLNDGVIRSYKPSDFTKIEGSA